MGRLVVEMGRGQVLGWWEQLRSGDRRPGRDPETDDISA
jgi:hypothetical protein